MDTAVMQLRLFVHQRLFAAAEKILGEVEKTITLALQEVDANRPKDNVEGLRHQLDHLTEQPAAGLPVTTSNMEHGEECGIQLLQENHVPATPEETPEKTPEVPGPSNPSSDPDGKDRNHCLVDTESNVPDLKEEQEQAGDEGPTLEAVLSFPQIGTCEKDQPEISYVIPPDSSSVKEQKNHNYCPFCNKVFYQMGALVLHANAHKQENKCKSCGRTYKSTHKLVKHFKSCCCKDLFCDVCGKLFSNTASVRVHKKIHSVGKFLCQVCGKTFHRTSQYTSHMKTHSGQPPYHCDVRLEEKPYQCGLCDKRFILNVHLKAHMIVHGERCGIQLLQENHVPSTPEETPEVPGPSNPSTDPDDTDRNHCLLGTEFKVPEIKEEQEQAGDEGPTLEAVFSFPEVGKFEQDQPELEISYEIQPDSSDCSAAGYERDNEEELVTSKGEQTTMQRTKNEKAALPHSNLSGKGLKVYIFCPFCDKGFLKMGNAVGHAYTHKQEKKCKICGKTCSSVRKLIKHFKTCRKTLRCDKRSVTNVHLKTHMMVHGEGCGIQQLQENHVPSAPEENPEVPGPSRPSTDLDDTDWNHCLLGTEFKVPEEQEQAEDEDPTLEAVFPFPEVGMFEQDQPELEISYEIQPESSDCSAAGNVKDNEKELVTSKGEQATMQKTKKNKKALRHRILFCKGRRFCPFCNKEFLYMASLVRHANAHKQENKCKICGKGYKSIEKLIKHFKICRKTLRSDKQSVTDAHLENHIPSTPEKSAEYCQNP